MTRPPSDDATPSFMRMLGELPAFALHPGWFGTAHDLARGRDGKGRAVLVLPGFLASDMLTARLRHTIEAAGYRAHGWDLGVNQGISAEVFDALLRRIDALPAPLSLVGWSLGGLYARELAKRRPGAVDRVVTLGSPFSGDLHMNRAWKLYEWINHHPIDEPPVPIDLAVKPPMPTFALWSAQDGIVAPAASRGLAGEADHVIEVPCRHMDFVSAPVALTAVLDALEA
ncbi:alpha/beta fold hydrolase [Sphingomonas solaris]|uniref:Alpha/beta hydrolase n=1 Tax=Alterirhizorhabdus solaris TaxID=2529389 RepID=A0A558QYE5_9SPHN|nr:alpha/beta hydrolase [Sphingomonas solaris]TVV72108.1 alpha/beta hydrolase [Sphingomonas solaris]